MGRHGELISVGLSWRTAPVAVRETLAFREEELPSVLQALRGATPLAEALLVSTCNRVEVYGVSEPGADAAATATAVRDYLLRDRGGHAEAAAAMYLHAGPDATQHIFRVAAALDSLVLGEAQILGQIKAAYQTALQAGTAGPLLSRCLERAFAGAKRVRTETAIARGAANVSSVAVELASRVFGDMAGREVLVVGAGKMSRLAAKHLVTAGATRLVVTNRSLAKAEALAAEIGGVARPWENLPQLLVDADVVISSTGAREPILTHKLFGKVAKQRRWRSMVVIDIAVPRDAEPRIADYDGVYLFDIDDLQKVVDANLSERAKASEAALHIVADEAEAFLRWLNGKHVVPTIRALRTHVTAIAESEAARVIDALARRDHTADERAALIARLGQTIANKVLHAPTAALKASPGALAQQRADALIALFGLTPLEDDAAVAPATLALGEGLDHDEAPLA